MVSGIYPCSNERAREFRKTRVRLPPSALYGIEQSDIPLIGTQDIAKKENRKKPWLFSTSALKLTKEVSK